MVLAILGVTGASQRQGDAGNGQKGTQGSHRAGS